MRQVHRPSVLFIAGEVSGDSYTARLAQTFSERHPDWVLHALGGQRLASAITETGGSWIGDTTDCSGIGVVSVLAIYPWAKFLSHRMRRFVKAHPPRAVVLCDWGGFNCGQLDFFRKLGIPVLYYFPPRSWQRTGLPGLGIAPLVDRVATPFDWSARRLAAAGCNAEWVGHPLLENHQPPERRTELRREFGVDDGDRLVALLPGSRVPELRTLAPRLAAAAELICREQPAKFVVAVPEHLASRARGYFPSSFKIAGGRAQDALLACDAAVVKTGTATLEAAVLGAPQVAVYDFNWWARIEWMLLWMWKKIPFIAMPNIILQRTAVPELLGLECTAQGIACAVSELLENEMHRNRMKSDYEAIKRQLGAELPVSATQRTAEILEEMLGLRESELSAVAGSARSAISLEQC